MSLYPGFSTEEMDEIFALTARVSAMAAVEAAYTSARATHGLIPTEAAEAIVAACRQPVPVEILADGWRLGTPVLGLLHELEQRLTADVAHYLHEGLTTQDVIDTSMMLMVSEALLHLQELAGAAAAALRSIIERGGNVATQARSFLQPADVTTVAFRTARWLDQLDAVRRALPVVLTPVQLGGLVGDGMGIGEPVVVAAAAELKLDPRSPWHTDRAPMIAVVSVACDLARWADKVGGDIAQLVQFGEITTRAGGSSAASGKRNPIDAMRAMAASEACLGIATIVTHAKPHELERGLGSWHAEWYAVPLVFQTAAAALDAIGASLASLEVEQSALVVADDRRVAADAFVRSVLERSP